MQYDNAFFAATGIPARGPITRKGVRGQGDAPRTLVAIAAAVDASLAAAGSNQFEMEIAEPGLLGRLILSCSSDIDELFVTSIKVNNDELIGGGDVPASLFLHDAVGTPGFGHPVGTNSKVYVTVRNDGAGAATLVAAAFTAG